MNEIHIHRVPFPAKVKGCVTVTNDGYVIFLNDKLTAEEDKATIEHELFHIKKRHFNANKPVSECEKEAFEHIKQLEEKI